MTTSLKAARTNAGLTLTEAAKRLGISKSTLWNYENHRTVPSIQLSLKMAELYQQDVNHLLFFRH